MNARWLAAATLGLGLLAIAPAASAATVPSPPASCSATVVSGGVNVSWTASPSDGGSPIKWYAIKIKGTTTTPVHTPDGTATSYLWTSSYQATDTFQIRAVNSVGFSAWCETPIGGSPPPPPSCLGYVSGSWLCSAPGPVDAAKTTAMRNYLAGIGKDYPQLNGIGGNQWGMVHADGTSSDPLWHLSPASALPPNVAALIGPSGPGFHAPANLGQRITGTSDSPGVVIDPVSGFSIWFSQAVKQSTTCTTSSCTLTVGHGGLFQQGTNGLDSASIGGQSDCPTLGKVCSVSRGRIPEAFLITAAEFATAKANHTGVGHKLEFFWPETDSTGCLFPMVSCEPGHAGWSFEGQTIALDPSLDIVDRPGCDDDDDVIVRTLQQNGAYIGDNAGGTSWVIKLEQDSPADPVGSGAFSTLTQSELFGCVTRSDFVATTS